ncbi:hypothetical protein B0H10DRAFT_2065328 [Mycena sp. CBHHK59/15]|nr:hypothetical protein B0H10DRAFT_2065328 [Mycena sp. CBHHK59/15]
MNKRKSRRRAADPCLRFYSALPGSPSLPHNVNGISPPEENDNIPPIAAIFQALPQCLESAVTVEAFLRRTTQLGPSKKYGKKMRQRVKLYRTTGTLNHGCPSLNQDSDGGGDSEMVSRDEVHGAEPAEEGKRLLQAAVLSHGDPIDCLQDDPGPSSRNPLVFIDQRELPRAIIKAKRRTWSLVDPRKVVPFHSKSFVTRTKSVNTPPKRKTLSRWKPTSLDALSIKKRNIDSKASKKAQVSSRCLPLSFVPLHEAEISYSLLRRLLPKNTMWCIFMLMFKNSRRSTANARKHRFPITEPLQRRRVPLMFSSVNGNGGHPSFSARISTGTTQAEIPQIASSLTSLAFFPALSPSLWPPTSASTNLSQFSEDKITLSVPVHFASSLSASAPPDDCDTQQPLLSSLVSPKGVIKNMKPLASFFDQFLETARSETQLQVPVKKPPVAKMPRKPAGARTSRPGTSVPVPVSTLTNFLCNTVRQTSSALHYTPAPPVILPNAINARVDYQASFVLPHFHSPSSPDIDNVLQQTPYQVVLPSTPPTSRYYDDDEINIEQTNTAIDSSVNLFCFNTRVCKCSTVLRSFPFLLTTPELIGRTGARNRLNAHVAQGGLRAAYLATYLHIPHM